MPSWRTTLTAAAVTEAPLRADYTTAARRVLRREQAPYLALRLLAAPRLVPFLAAGLAFMNLVDDTAEQGAPQERADGLKDLAERTAEALDTPARSADPVLRAYAHAVRTRGLPEHWVHDFLSGAATAEAAFTGFGTEQDYQDYLDAYALPGILVFTGLQYPGGPDGEQTRAWRRFVDAAQRVDFLADLAGDVAAGRICIPRERLAEHGVTPEDLRAARDTAAVRALLSDQCRRARGALDAAADVVDHADPGLRAVGRTMTDLMAHQLAAVERAGARALRRDIGYGVLAPLRILARARRRP
ncbi:squalene/phytoene synthase family protein [Kitasatospora sp. DSM 101779]|uniref:squalene/phytoene synthase family protein n=1 Tax=Kitasatospora sp. DSM 101779 TaxID=2853165 RepID=UPI0021D7FF55|nr:squalene/phytoene synthase family protein [Kitasatospora sp. DSM 101779]MCU7824215.1 squalene/phytoene synthase family protein [Kitasatospora sp. DSM 101779]